MAISASAPAARVRKRWRPTPVLLAALTLSAVLNSAGCFGGDDDPGASPDVPGSTTTTPAEAPLDLRIGKVTGKLKPAEAKAVLTDLSAPVLQWIDAAYLAGDYPRTATGAPFASFTKGAAEKARHDASLLSNATVGERIETVTTKGRRIRIDVLSVRHKVVGATARVWLVFKTEGAFAKTVTVKGRLFLTRGTQGDWRIFGYDLTRGEK